MGQPAAKAGDQIVGIDTHIVMAPSASGTAPIPLPHPFAGVINGGLSQNVKIMAQAAATVESTAENSPAHQPTPPGTSFQRTPSNQATIQTGSATVYINGKPAARSGDTARTCNDPADLPNGTVVAVGSVLIG